MIGGRWQAVKTLRRVEYLLYYQWRRVDRATRKGYTMQSVTTIFKIGIGPSSSHTLGPMLAAGMFLDRLKAEGKLPEVARVRVDLYGSLSLTGKGHLTDRAVILGLAGFRPESVVVAEIPAFMDGVARNGRLPLGGDGDIPFDMDRDVVFHDEFLPLHENAMRVTAELKGGGEVSETYYSVGGGEVATAETLGLPPATHQVPYPYSSAEELLRLCHDNSLSIAELALENERAIMPDADFTAHCRKIWEIMREGMRDGLEATGVLPGPLRVPRRAGKLRRKLISQEGVSRDPFLIMDWVNAYALAVSEENAAGGRVVAAPTNGSCGVVPAVMAYYDRYIARLDDDGLRSFAASAGSVGLLFRMNASLSGAKVGCQGEIGVACSMAAAGLAELMGAAPVQVCMAAEIGMEHNLGLTCDPVNGQVQIPCIERNAVNAVKAINAARMALDRTTRSSVSLDNVIAAMYATGKDMNAKYRETAKGGLAAITRFFRR